MSKARRFTYKSAFIMGISFLLLSALFAVSATKAQTKQQAISDISLHIAVVLNAPGPTMALTVTNKGKFDVPYYEAGQSPNRIIIIKPDGEKLEHFYSVFPGPGFKQPVLKPAESKTDKRNLFEFFGYNGLRETGLYRVYWIQHYRSNNVIKEHRSNEISILWEPGTPVFNPSTGRAEPVKP